MPASATATLAASFENAGLIASMQHAQSYGHVASSLTNLPTTATAAAAATMSGPQGAGIRKGVSFDTSLPGADPVLRSSSGGPPAAR
jgi:hypothetical protein